MAEVVITRGTYANQNLPTAIAGNIYRTLSPRFGTQINFQIAEGPDDETPNTGKDKKAAALNEEAKETKAATEAEENGDDAADPAKSGLISPDAKPVGGAESKANVESKVKATSMPIENKSKHETKNSHAPKAV